MAEDAARVKNKEIPLLERRPRRCFVLALAFDDIVTQIHTLVADVYRRPGYELANFILVLSTE
jgi:hypothetical protein